MPFFLWPWGRQTASATSSQDQDDDVQDQFFDTNDGRNNGNETAIVANNNAHNQNNAAVENANVADVNAQHDAAANNDQNNAAVANQNVENRDNSDSDDDSVKVIGVDIGCFTGMPGIVTTDWYKNLFLSLDQIEKLPDKLQLQLAKLQKVNAEKAGKDTAVAIFNAIQNRARKINIEQVIAFGKHGRKALVKYYNIDVDDNMKKRDIQNKIKEQINAHHPIVKYEAITESPIRNLYTCLGPRNALDPETVNKLFVNQILPEKENEVEDAFIEAVQNKGYYHVADLYPQLAIIAWQCVTKGPIGVLDILPWALNNNQDDCTYGWAVLKGMVLTLVLASFKVSKGMKDAHKNPFAKSVKLIQKPTSIKGFSHSFLNHVVPMIFLRLLFNPASPDFTYRSIRDEAKTTEQGKETWRVFRRCMAFVNKYFGFVNGHQVTLENVKNAGAKTAREQVLRRMGEIWDEDELPRRFNDHERQNGMSLDAAVKVVQDGVPWPYALVAAACIEEIKRAPVAGEKQFKNVKESRRQHEGELWKRLMRQLDIKKILNREQDGWDDSSDDENGDGNGRKRSRAVAFAPSATGTAGRNGVRG